MYLRNGHYYKIREHLCVCHVDLWLDDKSITWLHDVIENSVVMVFPEDQKELKELNKCWRLVCQL